MPTAEDNKQLMRRFTDEFWNRGNSALPTKSSPRT